jgi:hypothetical protein
MYSDESIQSASNIYVIDMLGISHNLLLYKYFIHFLSNHAQKLHRRDKDVFYFLAIR